MCMVLAVIFSENLVLPDVHVLVLHHLSFCATGNTSRSQHLNKPSPRHPLVTSSTWNTRFHVHMGICSGVCCKEDDRDEIEKTMTNALAFSCCNLDFVSYIQPLQINQTCRDCTAL